MNRQITRPGLLVLGVLVALLLGLVGASPATSDDTEPAGKGATVGLRPATAKGGDTTRSSYEYEVPPRGVVQDFVAVSNLRYQPITVRLFGKDATTTTDAPYAVQESNQKPTDVGAWMALRKDRLTIPPRSEVVVPFQVGVPYNAEPGEHAGAIVVSLLAKEPKPGGGEIIVDHRVSLRVLLRVPGDYKPALTISDVDVSWDSPGGVTGRGDTVVSYTVTNTGNLRVSATGDIKLSRVLGLPAVDARTVPITEIQPGGEMKVRQQVTGVFGSGPMKAAISLHPVPVDPDLKDVPVSAAAAKASFSAWPWLLIAVVVGLLLLLGAGAWFERRRRRARRDVMAPTGGKYRAAVSPDARRDGDVLVRVALAGTAVLMALGALLFGATPASADDVDVWQGRPSVKQGTDNTPVDVITSGGCPLPGDNVDGFMFGKGFPKEGAVAIGLGNAGVESRGAFRMPLSTSFQQLRSDNGGVPYSGVYRIELHCVTEDLQTTTGKYVFAIRFTDPTHWKVAPPITTAQGPVTTGSEEPDDSTDPEGSTRPDGSNGGPSASGSLSPEDQSDAAERAAELAGIEDPDAAPGQESNPNWWLIGGGAAVLVGTGALFFRRSRT